MSGMFVTASAPLESTNGPAAFSRAPTMSGGEGKGKSVAGYVSADIVVTEEMMREARALAGANGGERRRCGEEGGVVNGLVVPAACPPQRTPTASKPSWRMSSQGRPVSCWRSRRRSSCREPWRTSGWRCAGAGPCGARSTTTHTHESVTLCGVGEPRAYRAPGGSAEAVPTLRGPPHLEAGGCYG